MKFCKVPICKETYVTMWTNRLIYYYGLNFLINYIIMLFDFNHLRVIYYHFFKSKIKFLEFDIRFNHY